MRAATMLLWMGMLGALLHAGCAPAMKDGAVRPPRSALPQSFSIDLRGLIGSLFLDEVSSVPVELVFHLVEPRGAVLEGVNEPAPFYMCEEELSQVAAAYILAAASGLGPEELMRHWESTPRTQSFLGAYVQNERLPYITIEGRDAVDGAFATLVCSTVNEGLLAGMNRLDIGGVPSGTLRVVLSVPSVSQWMAASGVEAPLPLPRQDGPRALGRRPTASDAFASLCETRVLSANVHGIRGLGCNASELVVATPQERSAILGAVAGNARSITGEASVGVATAWSYLGPSVFSRDVYSHDQDVWLDMFVSGHRVRDWSDVQVQTVTLRLVATPY